MLKHNTIGQARIIDGALFFILLSVVLILISIFSFNNVALEAQVDRYKEDYVQSALLSLLYSSPDGETMTYSDLIVKYLATGKGDGLEGNLMQFFNSLDSGAEWLLCAGDECDEFCISQNPNVCKKTEVITGRGIYVSNADLLLPDGGSAKIYLVMKWI